MITSDITAYYNGKGAIPLKNSKVSVFLDKKDKKPTLNIEKQSKFGDDLDWGRTAYLSNKKNVVNAAYDILYHFYNEDIAEEYCHRFAKEMLIDLNVNIFVLTSSDVDRWFLDVRHRF